MPSVKLKTHKGSKKRFKVTATGKVMHKPCGSSHLNSHKSGKKIRRLRRKKALNSGADAARYRLAMRTRVRAPWRNRGVEVVEVAVEGVEDTSPLAGS